MPTEPFPTDRSSSGLLSPLEARVLGSLLEKEFSTPEIYPLTMNALVNACNQKNNRAPVMSLSPREVESALEPLRLKRLIVLFSGADARVPKYRQTLDLVFPMEPLARAFLTELLIRGPQTSAELRTRCERLIELPSAEEIEAVLTDLSLREGGPILKKLPRQPGQKEARWAQLLTGEPAFSTDATSEPSPLPALTTPPSVESRLSTLENEVNRLREELESLRKSLGDS